MDVSPWVRFTATERRERAPTGCRSSPRSTIHARHFASSIGRLSRALQMESYPTFHNEVGVPIVRIGCREFKRIGDKPPQDHPHIYLKMGDASVQRSAVPSLLEQVREVISIRSRKSR